MFSDATGPIPGIISVSPASGNWASSPQVITVSSSNSTIIYYTMVNTYDGSTPADPREPTSSDKDGSISVSGGTGTFQLFAAAGQYKRSKLRFRGYNGGGAGPASSVYEYSIDLRPVAVGPTINGSVPHNGSSLPYTPVDITVLHYNATAICYTMVNTYNGDTPSDPRVPSSSDNDGCIEDVVAQEPVWAEGYGYGIFHLYATAGQYKRSKIRFRAFNNTGAGPASDVYSFTINLRDLPGALTVNPSSGSWNSPNWNADFSTNIEIGGNNATAIYFTMVNTYDGSTPANPREPTSSDNDGYINVYHTDLNTGIDTLRGWGYFSLYAYNGQYKRSNLRFRSYNSVGAGPASGTYSYSIDLR